MTGPPFALDPPPRGPVFGLPAVEPIRPALEALRAAGGRPLLVGGIVRDLLMAGRQPSEDADVEVRELPLDTVRRILIGLGGREIGRSFAVLQLGRAQFALPRRERKTGPGHRGFEVQVDPFLPPAEAAARRDVTINSMALDPWSGALFDFHGGRIDLAAGLLRHTSTRFAEDPLRVLRVMQFAARFGFAVAPATVELCGRIDLGELPRERIWGEWRKLLLQGRRPALGLRFLERCGALALFPELAALAATEQDPGWHPEGTVWEHTLLVMDRAAELRQGREEFDLPLMLAALCHDLGKASTTQWCDRRRKIVSPRHESEGEAPTRSFLARLTAESGLVEQVVTLVRRHLAPHQLYCESEKGLPIRPALRRLLLKADPVLLERVARADHFGRRTPDALAREFPAGERFLGELAALERDEGRPRPLLLGRHLIAEGIAPGPGLGKWLERLFEAQLQGAFGTPQAGLELFREWRAREAEPGQ